MSLLITGERRKVGGRNLNEDPQRPEGPLAPAPRPPSLGAAQGGGAPLAGREGEGVGTRNSTDPSDFLEATMGSAGGVPTKIPK